MKTNSNTWARVRAAAIVAVAAIGLSACASRQYVDEQIADVNSRIQAVEARVQGAEQRADAAGAEGMRANQRIDQMEAERATMAQPMQPRRPRG